VRALATHALQYPPERREDVLGDLRARREQLKAAGCNYWVFEDPSAPGLLVEFLEARDAATLRQARHDAGFARADLPILTEVEL
jgi:hypothetical protein